MRKQAVGIFLGILLGIGLFLRLYKSDQYFMFTQDQALDMYALQDIYSALQQGDFARLPLIGEHGEGPGDTNIEGSIYHGSFFFYFLLPIAALTRFSMPGIVALLSIINAAGILLIYETGRLLFDRTTGVIAAALYTVSFWMVGYGNEIWTPTLQPFFVLVSLAGFAGVLRGKERYWPLLGFGMAAVSQVHSSGYLFWCL